MGQEILYCYKCQTRIVGGDFAKGSAFQVGDNVCCSKCAAEILHTLPPKDREHLLAQMFKATQERRSGGTSMSLQAMPAPPTGSSAKLRSLGTPPGGTERRIGSDTARRRWAEQSKTSISIAGVAVIGVAAVLVIMMLSRGGSGPAPGPVSRPTPAPIAPPADPSRGPAPEHEDIRKAREFARAHPNDVDGQLSSWRGALLTADKPDGQAITKEIERLTAIQRGSFEAALISLDAQTKPYIAGEEFALAVGLLKAARPKFASPEWSLAVDRKIDKTRADASKLLVDVKAKAADARRRGATEEINALQARVRKWGQPELQTEFEAALAGSETPPPSDPSPTPSPPPAVTKELEAYTARWDAAIARAVQGDTTGASQEITAALEGVKDAALRAQAAEDLDGLRAVGAAMAEIKDVVARTPKGQKVSLERWSASGVPERIDGMVIGAEPGRILVRTDAAAVPVEIGELTPALIADLFASRPGKKAADDRTIALLGILAGDVERAARLKVAIPDRWHRLAARAPGLVNAGAEAEARALYAEAEEAAADPSRVTIALQNYKKLLSDYAATAFVGRNRAALAARSNVGKEYLFFPDTLKGAGTFKLGKAGKVDAAWLSEKDSDTAAAAQNYVELTFTALPDAEYRLWLYAGACCLETFAFWVQGTDLPVPTAKSTIAEPGSAVVIPIRPTPTLKKTHAMHNGPKSPARWEWIPIPLPKYAAPGVKVVRFLTDQQGFAIAYASVSALTSTAPRESEVREIERLRSRPRESRPSEKEIPGLVAYWPFDEGSGATVAEARGRVGPGALQGTGVTWTSGRFGSGLRFDGGNCWVDLPSTPALNSIADGSYTIAAWFQSDDVPPGKDSQNNGAYAIVERMGLHGGLNFAGNGAFVMMQWFVKPSDPSQRFNCSSGTKAFPAGVFHHVAGTVDRSNGTLSVYVDGRLEGGDKFDPAAKSWDYGKVPWRIGIGGPDFTEWRWCAKGVIDEVRFYNRALSTAEIDALYRTPGLAPAPKAPAGDARPWRPIYDGKTIECIVHQARNAWVSKDGYLCNVQGIDNAGQLIEQVSDGEIRIRLESRGNSSLWFNVRQQGPAGYVVDLKQLGNPMNQGEHELVILMRGSSVTATVDGRPATVTVRGATSQGFLQFNCSVDGTLRIKSIEIRDAK